MNRRILLIDADHDFYGRLSDLLGRYRVDILVRPDPDEAIADGVTEQPALIVLAVDEPDKAGFKSFQQIKKGPLAKTPIILITKTVASSAMAKHRGLKTHADEYLDKRSLSDDELLGRLDNMIGLGEPAEPNAGASIDIPLEVDDLSVGSHEQVLEETIGDDGDSFDAGSQTVSGRSDAVDQMVAAETDAAFDALLGFGDEPAPMIEPRLASNEPRLASNDVAADARHEKPTLQPPMGDEPDHVADAAPETHAADSDSGVFDTFSRESRLEDVAALRAVVQQPAPTLEVEQLHEEHHQGEPQSYESSPAIQLDVDDIQSIDDSELIEEVVEDSGGVPEPVPHANLVAREDEGAIPPDDGVPQPVATTGELEPVPEPIAIAAPIVEEAPAPEPAPIAVEEPQPRAASQPPVITRAASQPPVRTEDSVSRQRPVFDLGLDAIAHDAEQEQSGVYDRKSLRKIGELERQIMQLKTELERARASADTPRAGSREREFFNLKEQVIARDADIRRLTGEVDAKKRELADIEERFRQVQTTRTELEAKAQTLEQQVAADSAKSTASAAKERTLASQLSSTQAELESKAQALAATELVRAQLERDLTTERANRAASASDAERALRVEREQMIARHQGELGQLRLEHAGAQAMALEKLRQEAVHDKGAALDAVRAERDAAIEVARKQAAATIDAARAELTAEAEQAASRKDADHTAELARLRQDHEAALATEVQRVTSEAAGELARVRSELTGELDRVRSAHGGELERATSEHAAALAQLRDEHARATADQEVSLALLRDEHAGAIATATAGHDRALVELKAELEGVRAELANARSGHDNALAQLAAKHAAELTAQANQHAAALAARENDLLGQRQDDAIAHTAALAELKAELDRQAAAHGLKLDGAKKEVDELIAQHEHAKGRLAEDHQRAVADQAAAHEAELAKLAADKQAALDDIARTQADHRKTLEAAHAQHQAELSQVKDAGDREVAELKAVLVNAKRAMDEAAARHTGEREAADAAHATALAEQKAQHERAMAVLNGEVIKVKAVGDAELSRQLAARDAEHDKTLKAAAASAAKAYSDISNERDELQRGLSAARDTIKRSEGELAAAVQTIADRNAELRGHLAGIGERDQRIAELRKEIEAIEAENASYQDQVLRAYQKIKSDEAMVARAKKAMAIALTVLDDDPKPKAET